MSYKVTSILTALFLLPLGLDHWDHSQSSQGLITELCKKEDRSYWNYWWRAKIFWLLIAPGPDPFSKSHADLPLALCVFYRQAAGDNQPHSEMSNRSAQDYEWHTLTCDFPHGTQTQPYCWSIAVVEGRSFSDPFPDFYDSRQLTGNAKASRVAGWLLIWNFDGSVKERRSHLAAHFALSKACWAVTLNCISLCSNKNAWKQLCWASWICAQSLSICLLQ